MRCNVEYGAVDDAVYGKFLGPDPPYCAVCRLCAVLCAVLCTVRCSANFQARTHSTVLFTALCGAMYSAVYGKFPGPESLYCAVYGTKAPEVT